MLKNMPGGFLMVLIVGFFLRELSLFFVLLFSQNEVLYFYSKKAHGRKILKNRGCHGVNRSFFTLSKVIHTKAFRGCMCPGGLRVFMMRKT